jgi:hypothetical protein
VDAPNLEWFTAILEECKSFDINDFLHDVNPYMVTRLLPPQCTAPTNISQSTRASVVPPRRIGKSDIFELAEMAWKRSSSNRQDTPSWDTLLREGS